MIVRGAHQGEGLGNQFLGHIRGVDAVALVCRCFANPDVAHVDGTVDPLRDLEVLDLELILADLAVTERRLDKVRSAAKARPRDHAAELGVLEDLRVRLQAGERAAVWAAEGETKTALAREMSLLTAKKRVYVANVGEEDLPGGGPLFEEVARVAEENGAGETVIAETTADQDRILKIRSNIYTTLKPQMIDILDVTVPPRRLADFPPAACVVSPHRADIMSAKQTCGEPVDSRARKRRSDASEG